MKFCIAILLWCILLAICWPLAVLAIVLIPFFWLLSIPFRFLYVVVEALFSFVKAVLFLPARMLGGRPSRA